MSRITITQVKNGFMAESNTGAEYGTKMEDIHVFQSFTELTSYLAGVFTFRGPDLMGDEPKEEP